MEASSSFTKSRDQARNIRDEMLTAGICDIYLYRSRYGRLEKRSFHQNSTASPSTILPRARLKVAGASGNALDDYSDATPILGIEKLEIRVTESR